jgi:hypothetical protein
MSTTLRYPAAADVLRLLNGAFIPQMIAVVAQLGIADQLQDGPRHSQDLAAAVGAHPVALSRLLRALASRGVMPPDKAGESHSPGWATTGWLEMVEHTPVGGSSDHPPQSARQSRHLPTEAGRAHAALHVYSPARSGLSRCIEAMLYREPCVQGTYCHAWGHSVADILSQ